MWLFPALSILTTVAMLAILVQMYFDDKLRSQLLLSLLSWAVVLVLFFVGKRFGHHGRSKSGVPEDNADSRVDAGQYSRNG
jgi:GABA permease